MKKITVYIFLTLLLFCVKTLAQHPVYYHLTEKDGLPDIEFYSILEDNKGFIWLAANKGLFRYDGKTFKNYTHPEKRGLAVFGLKKDNTGRIWCNNVSSQFFYIENDELKLSLDIENEVNGELTHFTFQENKLIINSLSGIRSYQLDNLKKKKFEDRQLIYSKVTNDTIYTFKNQKIYISTSTIKNKLKYNLEPYIKMRYYKWRVNTFNKKKLFYGYSLVNNKKQKLLYDLNNKLQEIELPKIFENNEIIRIYEVNNQLWFCTYKGVYSYILKDNNLIHQKTYLKNIVVSGVLKDRDQNYWFISLRNGIYIMPNLNVEKFDLPDNKKNISIIKKIGQDSIYLSSVNGDLAVLNTKTDKLNFLNKKVNGKIYAIDENKEKIFFSFSNTTLIYDKKKQLFYEDTFLNNAKDIKVIDQNNILNATHLDAKITNIKTKKNLILDKTRSNVIHKSVNNDIYVGYVDGVKKYNRNNKKSKKLFFKDKPIIAIDIDETSNGIIWISTLKDGIIGYYNNKITFNYNLQNGLLSNQVGKIKGDEIFLWITTDKGLQILNTKTGKFKIITHKDGLDTYSISEIIPYKNHIYVSSNNGIFKINKREVFIKRKVLDFYFTSILINDKKVKLREKYNLKYNEKKIQFNFQTNGFLGDDDIVYTYKILDDSKNQIWNTTEKKINQITFTNLAAGYYEIQLKATRINQPEEYLIKTIFIEVKLPFYKELSFIFLMVFILFVIYGIVTTKKLKKEQRIQMQQIEKERMQKELITSKLKALQSQMNPHFTFNALNSIQNLVLKNKKQDAYNYLTKFSSLLRENLHHSTKSFVYFDEELSIIKKYLELEKLRFRDEFSYQIIGEEDIDNVKIPTMIIQPFIENAINHGLLHKTDGIGKIKIEFYQETTLTCIITDNGVGIEATTKINKSRNKKSFSTKSIKSKLKILKDYYKTDIGFTYQKTAIGTKVIIKIPYTSND